MNSSTAMKVNIVISSMSLSVSRGSGSSGESSRVTSLHNRWDLNPGPSGLGSIVTLTLLHHQIEISVTIVAVISMSANPSSLTSWDRHRGGWHLPWEWQGLDQLSAPTWVPQTSQTSQETPQ